MRLFLLTLCLILLGCKILSPGAAEPKAAPSPSASARPDGTPLTLTQVRMSSGEKVNLVLDGTRIKSVGQATEGEEVDCQGLTVLPGFIDSHVHLGFFEPQEVVEGGLTTVRDLGWDPKVSFKWVEQSQARSNWGPTVLAVGPMVTTAGGYPFRAGWAPDGTAVAYRPGLISELADSGACAIKVTLEPGAGPTLSEGELKELVHSAHQRKLKVVAHVSTVPQLEKALAAGVDELAHFLFDSSAVPQPLLEQMVAQDVTVIPTLRVNPSSQRLDNLFRFSQAGGRVIYGTDLGNGGPPGIDIEELQLMSKAGLSSEDILDSATRGAAEYLQLDDRGVVAAGAIADLILVRGDPLKDWSVLAEPVIVIREGAIVYNSSAQASNR